jgi:LmbE family N-acetylglucosaminyl deacetylase
VRVATPLTLMAIHAHPDDESISTGGVLARYARAGVRTVLVTCTDGGCGDGPGGIKPMDEGFDRDAVVALRQRELERSCEILGVTHLETLGYRDSGMMGWPDNDLPGSFWKTPVGEAADRVADLMARYQPQVVVTYDAKGFYGHPDHIQAHRITMAAAEATGIPAKVYFTAVPRSRMIGFAERLKELGVEWTDDGDEGRGDAEEEREGPREEWGTPDDEVTTYVDVRDRAGQKFDSLAAHASQSDNIFFLKMGKQVFGEIMGTEAFVRALDRTGAPLPEDDLFAGLR